MSCSILKNAFLFVVIAVLLVSGTGCLDELTNDKPSATTAEVEASIFNLINVERTGQGQSVLTRNASLDSIARDYAASKFAQSTAYLTNIAYIVSNTWELDFDGGTPNLTIDTAAAQVEFCLGEPFMRDALLTAEATETGVGVVSVGSIVYFVQLFDVIWSSGADDLPIILVENPDATDPTWNDLKAFLEADATDENEYDPDLFICGDYAEALHNNAEAAGIRAAYVPVRLNQEPGHALNAFNVDGTTVFIDVGSADKVAYIETGKDYGVIELDVATQFSYTYFETYLTSYLDYHTGLTDYNAQVAAYSWAIEHGGDPPTPHATLQEWSSTLNEWLVHLNAERTVLGIQDGVSYHPTESLDTPDPTVVDYYVHW